MKGNDKFALLEKCERLYRERDYKGVIDACNEILETDLNNQIAISYKSKCLYLLDKNEEALKILDNAIVLYPNNHHYFAIKAQVLMDLEEYGKAIECFERVFEIGVSDETELAFIRQDYSICLSLKIKQLIERERYVEAWKCFNKQLEVDSNNLERSVAIDRFKRHVSEYTTKGKRRQYYVRITSDDAKAKLIGFLEENGFKSDDESGLLFSVDVVDKTFNAVSVDEVGDDRIISESKFYDKINYYPRGEIVHKRIFSEDNKLLYEGYTLHNAPYGFGTAYFADGKVYREGIFDIKGIVQGREYYPSGQLRFEGQWSLTTGYGPNAPYEGNAYGEDGELLYSGKFEIKRGGVGWPMIRKPKGFPAEQKQRPKIEYFRR